MVEYHVGVAVRRVVLAAPVGFGGEERIDALRRALAIVVAGEGVLSHAQHDGVPRKLKHRVAHRRITGNRDLRGVDCERRSLVEHERPRLDERVGRFKRVIRGGKRDRNRALHRERARDRERGNVEVALHGKRRARGELGVAVHKASGGDLRRAGKRCQAVCDAPSRDRRAEERHVVEHHGLRAAAVAVEVQELEAVGVRRRDRDDGVPFRERGVGAGARADRVDDRAVPADAGVPLRVSVARARGAIEGEAIDTGGRRAEFLHGHRRVCNLPLAVERIRPAVRLTRRKPGAVRLRETAAAAAVGSAVEIPPRDAEPAARIRIGPGRGSGRDRAGTRSGNVEVVVDDHLRARRIKCNRERDRVRPDSQGTHETVRDGRIERKRRARLGDDRTRREERIGARGGGVCGDRVRAADGQRAGHGRRRHVAAPRDGGIGKRRVTRTVRVEEDDIAGHRAGHRAREVVVKADNGNTLEDV